MADNQLSPCGVYVPYTGNGNGNQRITFVHNFRPPAPKLASKREASLDRLKYTSLVFYQVESSPEVVGTRGILKTAATD